ncbi:MAG: carbamoyltransferase [Chloroflexi bacterium]|nr:carbamoyltransferase [Chloroflexota bacterium]
MNILGINAYHGDASACLVQDGQLVAAAAEERFNRKKHWAGFPALAIRYCLSEAGIGPQDLDHVALSRDPSAHLHDRVLEESFQVFPRMMTVKDRLARVGQVPNLKAALARAFEVEERALSAEFHNVEHHRAHLSSAFFVSAFDDAAVLSLDGFGDFISTMSAHGTGNQLEVLDWVEYPHSLGLFYTAITQYLGFQAYGDESKVMGLAPYGQPRYLKQFHEMVRLLPGGRFELNLDYFTHHSHGVEMTWESGVPSLAPCWSSAVADSLGHVCAHLHERAPVDRLCLAGGVALNCTFNGRIRTSTPFKEVYIQPAAGDDGTAIGAAYYVYHQLLHQPRRFVMNDAYTGAAFSDSAISEALQRRGLPFSACGTVDAAAREAARLVAAGAVVGWFQGRMEFGPRALGNRSIVADPRAAGTREVLNSRIKQRETFRPFAPAILEEKLGEYFEQDYPSPFMLMAYRVREEKRAAIPAVTHVDSTGRVQSVNRDTNPAYWTLIKAFEDETGIPILLNTSFNENEPIVCTPDEAIDCFLRTHMDAVVLGSHLMRKEDVADQERRSGAKFESRNAAAVRA